MTPITETGNVLNGTFSSTGDQTVSITANDLQADDFDGSPYTVSTAESSYDEPVVTASGNSIEGTMNSTTAGEQTYSVSQSYASNQFGSSLPYVGSMTNSDGGENSYLTTDTFDGASGENDYTTTGTDSVTMVEVQTIKHSTLSLSSGTETLSGDDVYDSSELSDEQPPQFVELQRL